jgi:iron complex transport system permease protein
MIEHQNEPNATRENLLRVRSRFSALKVFGLLLIGLGVLFIISISLGSVRIPVGEVARILSGQPSARDTWTTIVLNFRLTKSLTAVLVGAALSVSGLQMQTLFRNPWQTPSSSVSIPEQH